MSYQYLPVERGEWEKQRIIMFEYYRRTHRMENLNFIIVLWSFGEQYHSGRGTL